MAAVSDSLGTIPVTKLDAARRQLETAVRLSFNDEDVVWIHPLISAAHTILRDIGCFCGASPLRMNFQSLSVGIARLSRQLTEHLVERPAEFRESGEQGLVLGHEYCTERRGKGGELAVVGRAARLRDELHHCVVRHGVLAGF